MSRTENHIQKQISIHAPAKGATEPYLGKSKKYYISIHAPAKGATLSGIRATESEKISIHAPAKGATTMILLYHLLSSISIHAPAKGATRCINSAIRTLIFQSTLPRRERRCVLISSDSLDNFNPRSREGSDYGAAEKWFKTYDISIHAPAKGAT